MRIARQFNDVKNNSGLQNHLRKKSQLFFTRVMTINHS